jgi:antitoxin PrlF
MERYKGVVTTTGNSEAIRFEKVLFRAHPEFGQGRSVVATVIAPGQLLLSANPVDEVEAEDPILGAFLAYLANDVLARPEMLTPLSSSTVPRAAELTEDIEVDDDEVFPDDLTI